MHAGDIIEVIVETNAEWWSGRTNGKDGLFPTNYVEKLPPTVERSTTGGYAPPSGPPGGQYGVPSPGPGGGGQYGSSGPGYYPPTPQGTGYYQPQGPPQYQQPAYNYSGAPAPPHEPQAPVAAEPPKEGKLGKLGDTVSHILISRNVY